MRKVMRKKRLRFFNKLREIYLIPRKKKITIISSRKIETSKLKINTQKKYLKISLVLLALIIILGLIVFIWIKKNNTKKEAESAVNKNHPISTVSSTPGKVIDLDNLNEEFPQKSEIISQGRFINVEQAIAGKALFIQGEKERFLRFENFEIVNGQDIHIYLSPTLTLDKNDAFDLGLLKTTSGNFNYSLDESINLEKYNNVIIWSNPFDAFFGYASLLSKELPAEAPKVEVKTEEEEEEEEEKEEEEEEKEKENETIN